MNLESIKRIQWVDVYKGLVIILVVIGHTTGRFNPFIYQFHMAAFFFISGYTANLSDKTILETAFSKFCTLLMPLLTVFFILLGTVISLDKLHLYDVFFSEPLQDIGIVIKTFFNCGDNYVLWMGACWFIITLFGIVVLHKILYTLCGGSVNLIYAVCSGVIFLYGYHLVSESYVPQWSIFDFDMIYIGQIYYFVGVLAKKTNVFIRLEKINFGRICLFTISMGLMWYFAKINPVTVDYPSRRFGNPMEDAFVAINGILFCYCLAKTAERFPQKFKDGMTYLGRNTLGILFFHFMFFNAGFYILYFFGIVPFGYLKNFVATDEIGRTYWPLLVVVSISLSLLLWELLCTVPTFNFLLGQNKSHYEAIWIKLSQIKLIKQVALKKQEVCNQIKKISWNEFKSRAILIIKENKVLSVLILLFFALACIPLIQPSIMCNDELQSRFWSLQGTRQFFDHMINVHINRGRALSAYLVSSTMYMGFLGIKEGLFRIIPAITIFIDSVLFGYLTFKILKEKYLSIFLSICIIAFLPITFEHTAPNAFTALYNVPFMFLIISLILYVEYLDKGRKSILLLSLFLFFITLTSYEVFVTYTPLYFVLAWYKTPQSERKLWTLFKKWVIPFSVSIMFLVLYFVSGKIFPSDYDGNQIGGFTITSSLAIISQLVKASFPGYFLFNKKYQFLMSIFWGNENVWQILTLRMILIVVILAMMCYFVFSQSKSARTHRTGTYNIKIISVGICFVILPTLPLAVAKMYQGIINPTDFIALPTTFFTYFSATFVACYLVWLIVQKVQNRKALICIAIIISAYCLPVQAMNETVLSKQLKDYDRLTTMEALFETNTIKLLDNQNIFSEDLYKTQDALGVEEGYWTLYAQSKGLNITITQTEEKDSIYLAFPLNDYFIIATQDELVLMSENNLEGQIIPVKVGKEGLYLEESMSGGEYDNGFYVYSFTINEKNLLQQQNASKQAFQSIIKTVGNTLTTCDRMEGYWQDGWVNGKSKFKIASGAEGKIEVTGYYPYNPTGKENIEVSINGINVMSFTVKENIFKFEVPCEKDKEITIEFKANFSKIASGTDKREVSYILSELVGK